MENTRHVLLKARLALVRRDLDPIVNRLTEIVATEIQLIVRLKEGRQISDSDAPEIIGDGESPDNLRRALSDVRQETLDYLDSLSEAELAEEVAFDGGWFASLMLPTVPRAEVFVNSADHEWYHVGQLTSYLWARGDNPYDW